MPRVLVTGANGFIGSAVVPRLLAAGYDVHAAMRPGRDAPDGVVAHTCDVTDAAQIDALCAAVAATHLLHLAWCTGLRDHKTSVQNLAWVAGGTRLIAAFRRNGGQRIVATGTYAEYGTYDGTCREDATVQPAVLYAAAKWSFGSLALAFGAVAAMRVTWARPFVVYGAGEPMTRLIPQLASALVSGAAFDTTDGTQVRDFIHVADVAAALVLLLGADHHGVANVGTGIGRPVREVVEAVAERLAAHDFVRLGAVPRPTSESLEQIADPATLLALGWSPAVPFASGLYDEVDRIAAMHRAS